MLSSTDKRKAVITKSPLYHKAESRVGAQEVRPGAQSIFMWEKSWKTWNKREEGPRRDFFYFLFFVCGWDSRGIEWKGVNLSEKVKQKTIPLQSDIRAPLSLCHCLFPFHPFTPKRIQPVLVHCLSQLPPSLPPSSLPFMVLQSPLSHRVRTPFFSPPPLPPHCLFLSVILWLSPSLSLLGIRSPSSASPPASVLQQSTRGCSLPCEMTQMHKFRLVHVCMDTHTRRTM